MKWENVLLLPFAVFVLWPLAALVPAGMFAAAYAWRRRTSSLVAAGAWGALVHFVRRRKHA